MLGWLYQVRKHHYFLPLLRLDADACNFVTAAEDITGCQTNQALGILSMLLRTKDYVHSVASVWRNAYKLRNRKEIAVAGYFIRYLLVKRIVEQDGCLRGFVDISCHFI